MNNAHSLTADETLVIDAMRSDGCVQLHFYDIKYDTAMMWVDKFDELRHRAIEINDTEDNVTFHIQYNSFTATYYIHK